MRQQQPLPVRGLLADRGPGRPGGGRRGPHHFRRGRWDLTALGFEARAFRVLRPRACPRASAWTCSGACWASTCTARQRSARILPPKPWTTPPASGLQRSFGELKDWSFRRRPSTRVPGTGQWAATRCRSAREPAGWFTPLYLGRWYAYAALAKQNLFADFLDATLSGLLNVSDLSYTMRLSAAFDPAGSLPFTFTLSYPGAEPARSSPGTRKATRSAPPWKCASSSEAPRRGLPLPRFDGSGNDLEQGMGVRRRQVPDSLKLLRIPLLELRFEVLELVSELASSSLSTSRLPQSCQLPGVKAVAADFDSSKTAHR